MEKLIETKQEAILPEIRLNAEEYCKKKVLRNAFMNLGKNRTIQTRAVYYENYHVISLNDEDQKSACLGIDEQFTHLVLFQHMPELNTAMTSGQVVSGDFEVKIFAKIYQEEIHFSKEEFKFQTDRHFLLETLHWLPIILNSIQKFSKLEL